MVFGSVPSAAASLVPADQFGFRTGGASNGSSAAAAPPAAGAESMLFVGVPGGRKLSPSVTSWMPSNASNWWPPSVVQSIPSTTSRAKPSTSR